MKRRIVFILVVLCTLSLIALLHRRADRTIEYVRQCEFTSKETWSDYRVQVGSNGELIVLAFGTEVHVWSLKECRRSSQFEVPFAVDRLALNRRNELAILNYSIDTVYIYDQNLDEPFAAMQVGSPLLTSFSADGSKLAIVSATNENQSAIVVDTNTLNRVRFDVGSNPCALSFSQDGRLLAIGNLSGEISVWNLSDRRCINRTKSSILRKVSSIHFLCNNGIVAVFDDGNLEVRVSENLQLHRSIETRLEQVVCAAMSSDERLLVVGGTSRWHQRSDYNVEVYELDTGRAISKLRATRGRVNHLAFARKTDILAVDTFGTINVWINPGDFE